MDIYVKAIACALVGVVLCLCLYGKGKEISLLLSILICVMVIGVGFSYLSSVFSFFANLQRLIGLDNDLLNILLKAVGVAVMGEIAVLVCSDAGQASLGKAVQLLTSAVILWISLPLYTQILTLIEELLTGI
jgi:stage III sporulation protein AD